MTNPLLPPGVRRRVAAVVVVAALLVPIALPADAQAPAEPPPLPQLPSALTRLPNNPPPAQALDCDACGVVTAVRQTTTKDQWMPLGTGVSVGGAPGQGDAPSAVSSFQIGPGFSNQGVVLLGAAGGGNYKQTPKSYEKPRWELTIKLAGGGTRVLTLAYEPFVREGDHVRIAGNNVELLD